MKALTYIRHGEFALMDKPKPALQSPRDAIVRVTLGSICTSDLHIKHGSVPRAVPGITVGHEMVGVVEAVGTEVKTVRPGDRVRHITFGEGEILSAKPMGSDILFEVMFDTAGTKKLMGTYAKLKRVE